MIILQAMETSVAAVTYTLTSVLPFPFLPSYWPNESLFLLLFHPLKMFEMDNFILDAF